MLRPLSTFSTPNPGYRRLTGLALGAALGLTYGLAAQWLDRALLPGVPLYQPPLGPAGNLALITLGSALLGLICAGPLESVAGIFLASAVSAAGLLIFTFISARLSGNQLTAVLMTSFVLALPFWGMLVPLLAVLRWGVNRLDEGRRDRTRLPARVSAPLLLILLAAAAGVLTIYRPEARTLLVKTDALLKTAQSAEALPESLRALEGGSFIARGRGPYQLAWEQRHIERYHIPRPGRNFDNHSAVVARFADGWNLVCLYITPDEPPLCKGFEELPQ